jgi:flagellar biosynthesis/type III secretory pathway protein FliH
MTDTVTKNIGQAIDNAMPHDLDKSLSALVHDLKAHAVALEDTAETALSKAALALTVAAISLTSEMRQQTAALTKTVSKDIKEHPITTAAAIITAAVALVGLVASTRNNTKT